MMTKTQFILSKIAEEASELSHAALKAQQFGIFERDSDAPTNYELIQAEFNDLIAEVGLLNIVADVDIRACQVAVDRKIEIIEHYFGYSIACGESGEDKT